jgi:hypothetical protein
MKRNSMGTVRYSSNTRPTKATYVVRLREVAQWRLSIARAKRRSVYRLLMLTKAGEG